MKILRCVGIAFLASFVLMATLVAIAPTLLSTAWGQGLCLKAASHVYPGTIELDSLSIGWLSGVDVHNLKVKDPQGRDLFSCTQFSLDRPLLPLLFSQKDFGSITVVSPSVYCYAPKNSVSSSKQGKNGKQGNESSPSPKMSFEPSNESFLPSATPDIKGHVTVSNATLVSCIDDKVVGSLSQGEVSIDLDLLHSSNGKVAAAFSQGSSKATPLSLTFTVDGTPELRDIKGSFSLSCNKVPTELLAALAHSLHPDIAEFLKESFGSSLSYSLSATVNGPAIVLHSALLSDNVRSDIHMNVENDVVTVDKGDLLTGTVSPRLFSLLVDQAMPSKEHPITLLSPTACSLENKAPLSFNLSELALTSPLDIQCSTKTPFSLSVGPNKLPISISVDTSLKGDPGKPSASMDITAVSAADTASFHLSTSGTKKDGGYQVASAVNINGKWPAIAETLTGPNISKFLTTFIGPSEIHLTMAGKYDINTSEAMVNSVEFSGSRLSASLHDMSCSFAKGLDIALLSPASARLIADKDMLSLLCSSPLPCSLAGPTELIVTVKPFTLSSKNGTWQASQLCAELQGKDIRLTGKRSIGPYSLSIPVSCDINKRMFTAEPVITSNTAPLLKGTSTVTLRENVDLPLSENISANCSIELFCLPTDTLELFSTQPLTSVIGDAISSKIACTFNGLSAKGNRFSLSGSGATWKADCNFALDALRLSSASTNAIEVEATVSSKSLESLKALMGVKSEVTIGDPVTVHLTIPQCTADLTPFVSQDKKQPSPWEILDALCLSAKTSFSAIQLSQKGAYLGRLPPLTATCDLQGKAHSLRFAVDTADSTGSDAMTIGVKGSFDNIWNKDGLSLPSSHLRSTIDIDKFPTALLDIALPQQGALLEEAIGKTIRITGDLSADEMKTGNVKLDLQSKNCSVHLDGMIQNGKMTLKSPAKASLSITKEAGTLLLKNVNPLLATAAQSQNPIQLTIDSQGAVIPLSPFSITGISLPKVTADVGKIVVKNGGALKIILALLNMGQAANSDNLDVWLTPIYMRVQGGVVTCQRADALVANKIHMITWGDVDLGHDKINMVVAIPQETLSSLRLKILTSTPERGLQIPITGSSSNPKIDTNRAAARLTGAAIVDNVPDPRLQIFGGLLQAAAASMGDPDQPIPPQTTRPFPWEK